MLLGSRSLLSSAAHNKPHNHPFSLHATKSGVRVCVDVCVRVIFKYNIQISVVFT